MTTVNCPTIDPTSGGAYIPWAPASGLPGAVKARLRKLVRAGTWDMADAAQIALHYEAEPRACDALMSTAERRP